MRGAVAGVDNADNGERRAEFGGARRAETGPALQRQLVDGSRRASRPCSSLALVPKDVFVKNDEIKIESQIGEGSFGVV